MYLLCKSAGVTTVREPPGLLRSDNKRPDGLTIMPWKRGRCLLWDATCPDTFAPSHLDETSNTPGAAAEKADVRKRTKYAELVNTYDFVTVALETTGTYNSGAAELIGTLGRMISDQKKDPRRTSYLWQQISVAIQRGNAMSISATHSVAEEDEQNQDNSFLYVTIAAHYITLTLTHT